MPVRARSWSVRVVELVLQPIEAEATTASGAGRYEPTQSRTTARNGRRGRSLATQAGMWR